MRNLQKIMNDDTIDRDGYFKKAFCSKLKELRKEKNLRQCEVAELLGCAVSTYSNWEQGRREPSVSDIYHLLWIYGIEANDLFEIND